MNSKISQLSSFVITAVWGDSEATMTQNGTLEYDKTGLSLSMSVSNSYSENTMNKSTRLFGTGILNSSSRNDEKFMTPVKVSSSHRIPNYLFKQRKNILSKIYGYFGLYWGLFCNQQNKFR
ncbi:hypothetical protein [Levilactobacillus brevis]|uniref:hypothetical protein n=1 Tax=Levilactobacillus brevis TaxID=1580 RepID=UPI000B0A30B1|nr:hypothetical protein [Levilactobacillus brevis]MDM5046349.1 hypothetical protein [Levilactobacillus brevis]